jgi:hypothetical protein
MSNTNIDTISGLFLGGFLGILLIILYVLPKINWIYFKNNNYNKKDILFIVFFSICLFSFTYICVNFITGQYKNIEIEKNESNENKLKINFDDTQKLNNFFIAILIIFSIIMIISNMNYMVNNQFEFFNNKYKATLNIFSVLVSATIIGLYFGISKN